MINLHLCISGRRLPFIGAAVLFVLAGSAVSGCQTTGGGTAKYLEAKYEAAVICARAEIDQRLTPKRESEDEVGKVVRASIITCEAPMNAYIQAMIRDVMDKRRWTWMGVDSQNAITDEIVLTTSLMLQFEYNEKERRS